MPAGASEGDPGGHRVGARRPRRVLEAHPRTPAGTREPASFPGHYTRRGVATRRCPPESMGIHRRASGRTQGPWGSTPRTLGWRVALTSPNSVTGIRVAASRRGRPAWVRASSHAGRARCCARYGLAGRAVKRRNAQDITMPAEVGPPGGTLPSQHIPPECQTQSDAASESGAGRMIPL